MPPSKPRTPGVLPGLRADLSGLRSDLPGLRSDLPGLRFDLPGLRSDLPGSDVYLPGLRPDVPGLSAPLSGRHVPLLRGQDEQPLENIFSRHIVQADAVAPHFTTPAYNTTPAVTSRAARSGPLDTRPAGLRHAWARTAAPAGDTAEQDFHPVWEGLKMGSPSKWGPMQEVYRTLLHPTPLQQLI